ncbi:hypothetical protein ACEV6Q_04055 [Enterobacter ludwigii]|uniref:hypothetical protein n=1 Tax=Enterobacter ludwigii TaxID=299767 RepID=UPI003BEEC22F
MGVARHIINLINDCFDADIGVDVCINLCELGGYKVTRAVVETIYTEREMEIA